MESRNRHDGDESNYTILIRMEERQKNLILKVEEHLINYKNYCEQNDKDVRGLYKTAYIGTGIILTLQFVILFYKH